MITKNIKKYLIVGMVSCVIGAATTSCEDMLETESSRQLFEPELSQKTDSVFYAMGIMQAMQQVADQYMFVGEMRGDLVDVTEYTNNHLRQLANFSVNAESANKYDSAYVYYLVINNCNYYIAHRDTTLRTGATYVAMDEYVAVKAMRAWAYMQLARTFGKVKFYTEPLTQISQIDNNDFPELDLEGIVSALAPDLEQYKGYKTPTYGNVSPETAVSPRYFFIPVDVVLGDMYLETNQYAKAAEHYVIYLTQVIEADRANTAFMQSFMSSGRNYMRVRDLLPNDFAGTMSGGIYSQWTTAVTGLSDIISYVPMAANIQEGTTTQIPVTYGYDLYSTSLSGNARYIDEIQIVPSESYTALSSDQDFYYLSSLSTSTKTIVNSIKIGDTRFSGITRENEDTETNEVTTWITKNNNGRLVLYRVTTVMLHLAEALNRLGMYDAAFAILKDGINKALVGTGEEGDPKPLYMRTSTQEALKTTYPLLSDEYAERFNVAKSYFGVHMHGSGAVRDYTGTVYSPGLSPYQLDTIVGLKMNEIKEQYSVSVGTTAQDTINAVEDMLCDEYALEFAFEGSRFFDLCRLARHKNADATTYGANFGSIWLKKKLEYKNPQVDLLDPNNWFLPFK